MEQNSDLPEVPFESLPYLGLSMAWMLNDVAVAFVRCHPDPARLRTELERAFSESSEGKIPFTELTPENQAVEAAVQGLRDALLRVASARLSG